MSEYHIASFIVKCHGKYLNAITFAIGEIQGAEVHEQDPIGKLIVTAEGATHKNISNITEQIRDMTHVADVAAVYHEYTSDDA